MRNLSATVSTAVAQDSTTPVYLVELGYAPAIRLSTVGDVSWNGQNWIDSGVEVRSIRQTKGGGQTASLRLLNHDNAYGALVLGNGIRDIPVDIYQLYGSDPYAVDDAEHLFSGVISGVPSIDDYVTMTLVSDGVLTARTPRVQLSSFLGEDMPIPGTRILWNGDSLVLESR
ncbi:MAG: hypothetical protein DBP02_15070 [gamma proteobacterium symbiont of Ctena orbiculata]|nr:MAG: hypothetical protein DBP02_15070 [gamma proteobacterium symbiont of Ctena orbiculata]